MAPVRDGLGRTPATGSFCRATGSSVLRSVPKRLLQGGPCSQGKARRTSLAIIMHRPAPPSTSGGKAGRRVGHCASPRAGVLAGMANRSERPVHSAEQPADPKLPLSPPCRTGFPRWSLRSHLSKGDASSVARGVGSLPVEVLGSSRRLSRAFRICALASYYQTANSLFDLAADVFWLCPICGLHPWWRSFPSCKAPCFAPLFVHAT